MRRTSLTGSTIVALGALVLAAAAIASPALAGRSQPAPPGCRGGARRSTRHGTSEPSITVHGTGTVTLTPDMATVVLGVQAQASTAKAAQANASASMNAVIAAVKRHNIAPADMATVNISLGPVYDYSGNSQKLVGWQATQSLSVKDRKLGDTGSLIDDAVAAGANSVQGVTLSVADPTAATAQARDGGGGRREGAGPGAGLGGRRDARLADLDRGDERALADPGGRGGAGRGRHGIHPDRARVVRRHRHRGHHVRDRLTGVEPPADQGGGQSCRRCAG